MIYFVVIIIIILLFLLIYPFKITIYNDNKYLYIKVSYLMTLKLNLYVLLDPSNKETFKKQAKGLKIINKLKFKEIDIYIRGVNMNYSINGFYYGILQAILPIVNNLLESNNITFNYLVDYNGEMYIKFKSVVKARLNNVIKSFYGL